MDALINLAVSVLQ